MKPKLLSPAGNWPMLKAAVEAGCDEVYLGIKEINMRATAKNFELSELSNVVSYCHEHNVKVNLTLNIIFFDSELDNLRKIMAEAKSAAVDAVICWDMAVVKLARDFGFEVHISTQASVANFESIREYHNLGAKRFILARELSLEQVEDIMKKIKGEDLGIEIETFCHGAMCVAISGRCFLSQEIFNKSANRGKCLQPCRRKYLIKDVEEGHELELGEDYVLSPQDLCTLPFLEKLSNIDVLKIEGRGRSPEYVSVVTSCYRRALDAIESNEYTEELKKELLGEIKKVYNRGFSSGFYLGKPLDAWSGSYGSQAKEKKVFVGYVRNYFPKVKAAEINVLAEGFSRDDTLQFEGNATGMFRQKVESIQLNNKELDKAEKGTNVGLEVTKKVRKNDKVFKIVSGDNK